MHLESVIFAFALAASLVASGECTGNKCPFKRGADPASYVNPRIGGSANGHTTAAAAYPFGMVQAGPDTGNFHWDYCSGYRDADRSLYGFSQDHLSGTGCPDLGDLLILPVAGELPAQRTKAAFDKASEVAVPGYYAVTLADGTRCEVAVAPHSAIWRFAFKDAGRHYLVIDPQWGMCGNLKGRVLAAELDTSKKNALYGKITSKGWVTRDWSFALEADRDCVSSEELAKGEGENVARQAYAFDMKAGEALTVKLALSSTGVEGARKNLAAETNGKTLEDLKCAARAEWNKYLSRMEVPDADEGGKISFYTSLYHLFFQPNNIADVGERPFYSTFSCWDTFRAAQPLYTIIASEKEVEMVGSLLEQGRRSGYMPIWTLWGKDNQCMIGNHSIPMVIDAYFKGLWPKDESVEAAYAQIRDSVTRKIPARVKDNFELIDKYGYIPFDVVKGESVSRLLECSYDDACVARFAKALGKKDDAKFFEKRSLDWRNVFDKENKLVRGRDSKGGWRTPYNPFSLGHGAGLANDYTEGNAWQYTWHVMQDPEGMVAAQGGKATFAEKLLSLFQQPEKVEGMGFTADVSGLIGQYAHGNEPSHHTIYFFQYADRGDLTAKLVREVFDKFYLPKPDGLCGNDDCGQMSAWYLFSAAGFYPFDPCAKGYVIGAPQFKTVVFRLPGGKNFTVRANGISKDAKYVKSVTLNGKKLDGFKLTHEDVMKGGELVFEMQSL